MILTAKIDTSIIKKYDIRGIIGQNLKVEDGYEIGKKFAQFLGTNAKICVGYDGRVHSPQIEKKVIEGLCFSGANVIRVGLCSSPMLYFATQLTNADGGIMITASHNPAQYNGFKFYSNKIVFSEKEITTFMSVDAENSISNYTVLNCNIYTQYIEILKNADKDVGSKKKLKIAWNCSNGATSSVIRYIQKILPNHEHITINNTIDGSCNPDPIEQQNLNKLINTIREHQCDIGIALDGDGDRVCIVDSEDHIVPNDYLFMIFVKEILTKGDKVIIDIKISMKVFDLISKLGGIAITCATGHSIIKKMMIKESAKFAGELSGHFFFAEIGFDDGMYAAVKLINILQKYKNLDGIMRELPKLHISPEIKIEVQEEKKFQIIDLLKKELEQKNIMFSSIDGIKITFEKGWLLLRASNTQNYITARCEGKSNENFKEIKNVLDQYIERIKLLNKS
ncbi:phosphomannomutase/phosphoglucomutase [Candidatus Mesenet endosymbiont of Phosphuga atrata]|uniref:phosphomannomutase/phosphoglucomutase n=1 Tax=Candidatus Mesenet endosymbiont of Phosphuga atrata TaxID=3066221 RepID=UPI0030D1E95E